MKALFEICSDDCTYSYENLIFVMGDEVPYTIRFQEKIMEMYPDTDFLEYAKLVLENESIEVVDEKGYRHRIQIQEIQQFD